MISDKLYAIGAPLANHLWQSTLFAAVVWMLTLALHKNQARVRYCLWLAASLKFLLPFSLLILAGDHLAKMNRAAQAQAVFYFVVQTVSQPFHQAWYFGGAWPGWLPQILAALWLGGFATVLTVWWLHWRQIAVTIRGGVRMFDGREVEALRRRERLTKARRPIAVCLSQGSTEPGVFGIARPILLWPAAISDRLQDAHLEAILAHEVEHVRRQDNLTAALHMVVEAIFWFHPLVWWLGARLMEERERACDEEVLELGNPPQIYAESILKTCEFCVGSSLACVSGVAGGDLKQRIVRIMSLRSAIKLSYPRKFVLGVIGIGAVASPMVAGLVKAPPANAPSPQTSAGLETAMIAGPPQSIGTFRGDQLYHVGGGVTAPKLLYAPDAEFSAQARRAHYQGVCVIALIVDLQGKPQRVQVVRHLGMGLDKKAVEAVRQYKFTPAMRNSEPVAVEVNIEVNFRRY